MARVIRSDGAEREIFPADPVNGFGLTEMYSAIGCEAIEAVRLRNGGWMIVDEEGIRNGKSVNQKATEIYWANGGPRVFHVLGDVLIGNESELQ